VENLIWDRVWICCKTLQQEIRVKTGIADHHLVILRTGVRISAKELSEITFHACTVKSYIFNP
jgi:hypothetical protein